MVLSCKKEPWAPGPVPLGGGGGGNLLKAPGQGTGCRTLTYSDSPCSTQTHTRTALDPPTQPVTPALGPATQLMSPHGLIRLRTRWWQEFVEIRFFVQYRGGGGCSYSSWRLAPAEQHLLQLAT